MEIYVPSLRGEVATWTIGQVLVKQGQRVETDEPLFEAESKKGVHTICANVGGTIEEILIREGQEARTGQVALRIMPDDFFVGTVKNLFVQVGQRVTLGQPIFSLEIDGKVLDVPADSEGTIRDIYIREGQEITSENDLFYIEGDSE